MRATFVTLAAALALLCSAAAASGGTAAPARVGGLVPHSTARITLGERLLAAVTSGPLIYHLGPVMHSNETFAIYWVPSGYTVDGTYKTAIDGYLTDVAAASGQATNVYSVGTQYYDTTGSVAYQSTFGGSVIDTDAFPANGCSVTATCLTDSQLQNEIQHEIAVNHWPEGLGSLFFILTPSGVGSCIDSSNTECSTNVYCAYHSAFADSGTGQDVVYANEPYDAAITGCNTPESPNSNAADSTINTISHEQNEAITDPLLNAWFSADSNQDEVADLCAWVWGSPLGGSGGSEYNQVINSHDYWLQEEYSNDGSACLQHYVSHLAPTNVSAPAVSGTAAVGQKLSTSTGSWAGTPTAYAYQWQRCSFSGGNCANIPGATGATYTLAAADGGQTVRSTVSAANGNGASAYASSLVSNVVVPLPATTVAPVVSGVAAVGKTLSTTSGTWNTPSTFGYQWLRCADDGSSCSGIPGATHSTYVVANADGGHVLEARISASNQAGTATALSNHTALVVAKPAATDAPRITGAAKAGDTLKAATGAWSSAPTAFGYQWLRCDANGSNCTKIARATKPTYRATQHDVGHRLRVRVTARNRAGGTGVLSAATARVRG